MKQPRGKVLPLWLQSLRERQDRALDLAIGDLEFSVSALHIRPGDLVVCTCPGLFTVGQMQAISERVYQVLAKRGIDRQDVLVLSGGMELRNYCRADATGERIRETATDAEPL